MRTGIAPADDRLLTLHASCSVQAFEDTLGQWMAQFHSLLTYNNPALAEKAADKESCLDAAKAAVCANINLFLEINDEEFGAFVETFVRDVWTQLVTVTLKPGQARLPAGACLASGTLLQLHQQQSPD